MRKRKKEREKEREREREREVQAGEKEGRKEEEGGVDLVVLNNERAQCSMWKRYLELLCMV